MSNTTSSDTVEGMTSVGYALYISAAFSLVGSSTVMLFHLAVPPAARTFIFRLVLWMMFAEFFKALTTLLGGLIESDHTCVVVAIMNSFGDCASLFWTACIGHTLYDAVFNNGGNRDHEPVMKRFHKFSWGLSFILTIIPLITGSYGEAGGWCWIVDDTALDVAMRYIQLYGPLWIIMSYCVYVYYLIYKKLAARDLSAVARRCAMYPMVLVICWTFPSINRVNQIFNPDADVIWLNFMHALMAGMTGFFNAVAYGISENSVLQHVKVRLGEMGCPCCEVGEDAAEHNSVQLEESRN